MNGKLISNHTFGDRLYTLREKAGYNTHRELALVICGYPKTKKGLMGEDEKRVGRMRRNIQNWEVGKNIPNAQTIATLCNLLDCDPDYLLYEDTDCPRKEIKRAADTLGLSNEAVKVLLEFMQATKKGFLTPGYIISTILENPSFYRIIGSIMETLKHHAVISYNEKQIWLTQKIDGHTSSVQLELKGLVDEMQEQLNYMGYAVIGNDDMTKMLEFKTNQSMGDLIRETLDILQDEADKFLQEHAKRILRELHTKAERL